MRTLPHFSAITKSHEKLPTVAYFVPHDLDYRSGSSEISVWQKASGRPVPAIRFKVEARVGSSGYKITKKPEFSAGILRLDAIRDWASVPNIQQLWFPAVWASTTYPLQNVTTVLFEEAKGKPVHREFSLSRSLDALLDDHQKIFITIVALHAAWAHLELPKARCAEHIVQLGLKSNLEPNNFSNYAVEAGWGEMGDSQVERLWAKVMTAQRRAERFEEELRERREKDLQRFAKTHRTNPFLFNILQDFAEPKARGLI